jgi:hypothetical protein
VREFHRLKSSLSRSTNYAYRREHVLSGKGFYCLETGMSI